MASMVPPSGIDQGCSSGQPMTPQLSARGAGAPASAPPATGRQRHFNTSVFAPMLVELSGLLLFPILRPALLRGRADALDAFRRHIALSLGGRLRTRPRGLHAAEPLLDHC